MQVAQELELQPGVYKPKVNDYNVKKVKRFVFIEHLKFFKRVQADLK